MEIKVEDIIKGDEIIILGQSPKYIKVLETPKVYVGTKKWNLRPGDTLYQTIRCHINVQILTVMRNRWMYQSKSYVPTPYQEKTYVLETPKEGEGIIKKLDLNYHRLWLVKREL